MSTVGDAPCNFYNLARRFAQAEDHLRLALPHGAVVIHAGKAQILVWGAAKGRDQAGRGVVGRGLPAGDGGEERTDGGVGHETCKSRRGRVYADRVKAMQT